MTATFDTRPEIGLPDLSGIVVDVDPIDVSDHDVDEHVERLRRRLARFTDVSRKAAVGDIVRLSLHASIDGADFDRSRANDVPHEVGSGHLLPGLDAAVLGLGAGESTTIRTQLVESSPAATPTSPSRSLPSQNRSYPMWTTCSRNASLA